MKKSSILGGREDKVPAITLFSKTGISVLTFAEEHGFIEVHPWTSVRKSYFGSNVRGFEKGFFFLDSQFWCLQCRLLWISSQKSFWRRSFCVLLFRAVWTHHGDARIKIRKGRGGKSDLVFVMFNFFSSFRRTKAWN